jgi:hypothetical protein
VLAPGWERERKIKGRTLTRERGWRRAPVLATGGSSAAQIEARQGPTLVLHSTQKQEAPSKHARGRRPAAVCVPCSLVRRAIAGGRGGVGWWRLAGLIAERLVWWGSTSNVGHQEGDDDEPLPNEWRCSGSGSH